MGIKLNRSGQGLSYPVIIFGGEHADIPLTVHAGPYVAALVATGNRPCIGDLGGWTVGDRTRFLVDFAQALFRHTRGPRWLCIDEAHTSPRSARSWTRRPARCCTGRTDWRAKAAAKDSHLGTEPFILKDDWTFVTKNSVDFRGPAEKPVPKAVRRRHNPCGADVPQWSARQGSLKSQASCVIRVS